MPTVVLFIRELCSVDYAYYDPRLGVRGDTLLLDAELRGERAEDGLVFDFSRARKAVKAVVDGLCDHRFIVPPGLTEETGDGRVLFRSPPGAAPAEYRCPPCAVLVLPGPVGPESIAAFLEAQARAALPENVRGISIRLRPEPVPEGEPVYSYCHGLRGHDGRCRHLFHGHRSRLEVVLGGTSEHDLARGLCAELDGVHFCRSADIEGPGVRAGGRQSHLPLVRFGYDTGAGRFQAVLPGREVWALPEEGTVENIALHLAERVGRERGGPGILLACEGAGKGAAVEIPPAKGR